MRLPEEDGRAGEQAGLQPPHNALRRTPTGLVAVRNAPRRGAADGDGQSRMPHVSVLAPYIGLAPLVELPRICAARPGPIGACCMQIYTYNANSLGFCDFAILCTTAPLLTAPRARTPCPCPPFRPAPTMKLRDKMEAKGIRDDGAFYRDVDVARRCVKMCEDVEGWMVDGWRTVKWADGWRMKAEGVRRLGRRGRVVRRCRCSSG